MKVLILSCVLAVACADLIAVPYSLYPQHIPVIGPNGVPVETPEVQHAKAAHYAAHAQATARTAGVYAPLAHVYGVPTIAHNALPLDTPEVAAAKAQHYVDYAAAAHRNGVAVAPIAPIAHHVGAYPADTPEVAAAKIQHFAAHAAARAGHYRKKRAVYPYLQHVPVIGPNGVPVETPEVQAAKAEHFAAHAKALGGHPVHYAPHYAPLLYGSVYPHAVIGPNGQPLETPEVQHAKAAHFAAHAAARGHYYHY